jgi:hypothetical protein
VAITEDTGNQPTPLGISTAWTGTNLTSAAFSPQANTLIVALVSGAGNASSATTATVTDSLAGTWTLLKREGTADAIGCTVEVWCRYVASAPGSMTVKAVGNAQATPGAQLTVRCLLGASSTQAGATASKTNPTAATVQQSITAGTGSWVYGAAFNWTGSTAMTVLANTTAILAFVDGTNGDNWASCKSTAATAGTATYGYSTSTQGKIALVEIQASGGAPALPPMLTMQTRRAY